MILNGVDKYVSIICGDAGKAYELIQPGTIDSIICNPPYFKVQDNSSFNDSYEKRIARHEICINLEEICDCAKKILKDNGNLCIVHRSDRLMEILEVFRLHGIEPKRIKFIYETIEKESTLVLVEGQKCGKVGLIVDKPLIQYHLDGSMTEEYSRLQREIMK